MLKVSPPCWLLSSTFVICPSSKTGQNYPFSKWLIYFVCKSTSKDQGVPHENYVTYYSNNHLSSIFFQFEIPPSQSGFERSPNRGLLTTLNCRLHAHRIWFQDPLLEGLLRVEQAWGPSHQGAILR